jgi:hypothetical protein
MSRTQSKKGERSTLLVTCWLEIHWRNMYGSGLLLELSKTFDEIIIAGISAFPMCELPKNVRTLNSRLLFSDKILFRLADIFKIHEVQATSPFPEELIRIWKSSTPKLYFFSKWFFYPAWILYLLLVLIRLIVAFPVLRKLNPTIVLSNSFIWGGYESIIGLYAKIMGIPWFTMVTSWDNPATKGRFILKPDHAIVWGEQNQQELHKLQKVPEKKITALTPPHFMRIRNIESEFPREKKSIVFIGVTRINYHWEHEFIFDLIEALKEGNYFQRYNLVLRPHPNDQDSWISKFSGIPNVEVDPEVTNRKSKWTVFSTETSSLDSYYKLFRSAAVVITHYSTAMVESGLMRVPCIVPRIPYPNNEKFYTRHDHYVHSFEFRKSPGTFTVSSSAELRQALMHTVSKEVSNNVIEEHFRACEKVAKYPPSDLFCQYAELFRNALN